MSWQNWQYKLVFILLSAFTLWWLIINIFIPDNAMQRQLWSGTHGLVALFGAIIGLINARAWGWTDSLVGKAMIAFSFGLLCQEFGQIIFAYYVSFRGVEVPYPSLADAGYFTTLPLYIYGAYLLSKWAESLQLIRLRHREIKIIGMVLFIFLVASVPVFFHGYSNGNFSLFGVLFSYLYLLSNTAFVFLAIAPYLLLRRTVQWSIYRPVIFFSVALVFQYLADYTFYIQVNYGIWIPGGVIDYIYFLAYGLMAVGLIRFRVLVTSMQRVVGLNEVWPYFIPPFYLRLKQWGIWLGSLEKLRQVDNKLQ